MRDGTWRAIVSGLFLGVGLGVGACGASPAARPGSGTDAGSSPSDGGTAGEQDPASCSVPSVLSCPDPMPHYADVAPLFEHPCGQCHNDAPGAPWSLSSYGHIADWQDTIRDNLRDCSMPPPDSGVLITPEERTALLTWLRCGLPR